jgi:predicted ATPase
MLLDPLHQVDDASLAVLEAIIEQQGVDKPADLPLLILGTARPEFLDQRLKWQEWPSDPFAPYLHLDLQPLSAIDSRHMLVETLQRLPSPPLRLLDLIAAGARGNPLFMEEMVKLLLNKGVIITDPISGRWRVEMPQVEATRLPTTLDELFHARLAQMPPPERQLLAAAATMGLVFWDAALWQETGDSAELPASVVDVALLDLEQKRLIAPNEIWSFANTQAYTFAHRQLRDAAYDALSPARRRAIHQQVAQWLLTCRQYGRIESRFPPATLIAHHLEQAGGVVETLS